MDNLLRLGPDGLEMTLRAFDATDLARVIRVCTELRSVAESVIWRRTIERGRVGTDQIPNGFTAVANYLRRITRLHVQPGDIPGGFTTMASYLTWFEKVTLKLEGGDSIDVGNALEQLSRREPRVIAFHSVSLVGTLKHGNPSVRKRALEVMGKLDNVELMKQTDVLFNVVVRDDDYMVRKTAEMTLDKLEPVAVARAVVHLLDIGSSVDVKYNVLLILGKLRPDRLREYSDKIVGFLRDGASGDVRGTATRVLRNLDPVDLRLCASAIFPLLGDPCDDARRTAVITLGKLDACDLATYAAGVVLLLADPYISVRRAALKTLGKLSADVLEAYADDIASLIRDEADSPMDLLEAALETLGKLREDALATYADDIVGLIRGETVSAAVEVAAFETLCKLDVVALQKYRDDVVRLIDGDEYRHLRRSSRVSVIVEKMRPIFMEGVDETEYDM